MKSRDVAGADIATTTNEKRKLTLAEAKALAFENNWDLLAARSDVDFATAQKIVSREFPNPNVSLSAQKINADGHPSRTLTGNGIWQRSYDTIFAVNQLFEIGGKRVSRQASASAGFAAAEARLQDARRLLDQAVGKAYIAVLLGENNARILRDSATSLRKEAAIAEARFKAGEISKADQSQIEIAAERLELDAKTAEATTASARISLEVLLGISSPTGDWTPADSLDATAEMTIEDLRSGGAGSRPDLLAAEAMHKKAEADLRLQKGVRYPDPTFFVQYEHEPPDQPNTIGFGVSIPVPIWNRNRGAIQASKAAQNQAAIQVDKIKTQIASEIAAARLAYADATSRLNRQRTIIQPRSAEIRKSVLFAYEKGSASLLDLLSAERNDNDIRLATAQAAADTANAAVALKAALNLSAPPPPKKKP